MTRENIVFTAFVISMVLVFAAVIGCSVIAFLKRRKPEWFYSFRISTVLIFSALLILSIWAMRFAIEYFAVKPSDGQQTAPSVWGPLVYSFLKALRTIGLEEDYSEYIGSIKALIDAAIPVGHWIHALCRKGAVLCASVQNVLAPIVGGAVVLDVLASIFPKMKLRWTYCQIWRPKYFFGELNQSSLALAKSIQMTKKGLRPVLIFTDTYVDDENEKEYELLQEAKRYGAICIRDDVAHIAKPWFGKREYYLMNENEFENLKTLMALTEKPNVRSLRKSCTYVFVQSDAYVQIEKQIKQKLQNYSQKWLSKESKKPVIIPVNGYRNLVQNLFCDVPLYEPLVDKEDPTNLNVTILGNGSIGTEAFLCTYWIGQMMISGTNDQGPTMTECKLTVNVVSKDPEGVFWSKIDYINPEIRETSVVLRKNETVKPGKILAYNSTDPYNNEYCTVRYTQADVKNGGFWSEQDEKQDQLLASDYIIVALGNDADNISVAEKIRRAVGKKHLEAAKKGTMKNVVIAYAVFNSELAVILNEKKRYQTCHGKADIYMHAFGSLDEVYSCDNVYMSKNSLMAKETDDVYRRLKQQSLEDNERRFEKEEDGNYSYWANLARAAHMKYKVFSLGWIDKSVFSYPDDQVELPAWKSPADCRHGELIPDGIKKPYKMIPADDYHREYIRSICKQYKRLAIVNFVDGMETAGLSRKADLEIKKHCLAWLEHRRWNAFTRTMGYQHIEATDVLDVKGSQKDMPMKLHACLVEARYPGIGSGKVYILADFLENGKIDSERAFDRYPKEKLDALDEVSYARKKRNPDKSVDDFKTYDYYRYEFDDYLSTEELLEYVSGSKDALERGCEQGRFEGAFWYPDANEWYIPFKAAKHELGKEYFQLDPDHKKEDKALVERHKGTKSKDVFQLFGEWFGRKEYVTAFRKSMSERSSKGSEECVRTSAN